MTPLPSDVRLARRAAAGDQRAFTAIYKRYHQRLYRFCLSVVGRPEDAQDALQNTMVKALRALPGEEREIQLKPWLYRIAHNESVELLRRRRDEAELDPERAASAAGLADTVASRERLGQLLADLGTLPERQRSALVMRELGGLGFDQIGEAFETSDSVARQTVYEARLSLRQLEAGREMSCEKVKHRLSDADGRALRRRDVQAHLQSCPDCRAFSDAIEARRHDLAALAPLPAVATGAMLQGLLAGGQAAGGGLAGAAGTAGAGAGKVVAGAGVAKTVATVAVVAAVGAGAADRGGLIDAGLPGGKAEKGQATRLIAPPDEDGDASPGTVEVLESDAVRDEIRRRRTAISRQARLESRAARRGARPAPTTTGGSTGPQGAGHGRPEDLPPASQHGQQAAAAHKATGHPAAKPQQGNSRGPKPQGSPKGSTKGTRAHGAPSSRGKSKSAHPHSQQSASRGAKPVHEPASKQAQGAPPSAPAGQPAQAEAGGTKRAGSSKAESSP